MINNYIKRVILILATLVYQTQVFGQQLVESEISSKPSNIIKVRIKSIDNDGNPISKTVLAEERNGSLIFEGDIILGNIGVPNDGAGTEGIVHANQGKRWTDGVIPFAFEAYYTPDQKQIVFDAMLEIESYTNVRFVRHSNEANYVAFVKGNQCASDVGMIGLRQTISLDSGCFQDSTPEHEILHALGVWHEQSRADRDQYVEILEENIIPANLFNFDQQISDGIDAGEYDYISLMHYPKSAFTSNGLATIVRRDNPNAPLGNDRLSQGDIDTLQFMYGDEGDAPIEYDYSQRLDFVPPASNSVQQGFLRLANLSGLEANVVIFGVDDNGNSASGSITFTIAPYASQQINSNDIEFGNSNKGLAGSFGNGTGNWRLSVLSDVQIGVSAFIRTSEGFLTQVDAISPASNGLSHTVPIFNPASNVNQVSKLRIINVSQNVNIFTITGVDDNGTQSQSSVTFELAPEASIELTSQDLENGNSAKNLNGSIGDGTGKWLLEVSSTKTSRIINLLEAPGGYLSNLSYFGNKAPVSTNISCRDVDGARIYGGNVDTPYLGFFGSDIVYGSVNNPDTDFGSSGAANSIMNTFGLYGSFSSNLSHRNPNATIPPIVVKNGKELFRLSTNSNLDGVYSLDAIRSSCDIDADFPTFPFSMR